MDASSSIITLIGFRWAAKPSDEDHPYGHQRIEYVTGLIISVLIIFVGFQLILTSIDRIQNPSPIEYSLLMVIVLILAILIKLWQYRFNIKMGEDIGSTALKATGIDSRNDALSTTAVLISLGVGYFSGWQIDGIMGLLVALFIIYSGIMLIKETSGPLLGQAPDPQLVEEIKKLILNNQDILGIHDLIVHDYGPGRVFATVHAEVDVDHDVMRSHDLLDNIEKQAYEQLRIHLVIHMDPIILNDPLVSKVKVELEDIIKDIDYIEEFHDLRVVQGVTHHNIVCDIVVSHECPYSEKEIKKVIADCLLKCDPDYRTVITVEKSYSQL